MEKILPQWTGTRDELKKLRVEVGYPENWWHDFLAFSNGTAHKPVLN